ncbi:shikimate dehydrogenase [Peptoclostridium litorale DSM 5388]|uniref:Shikimate dehydrogenase (NADP(+)) n=1 Tax=Peptoclostridium litorale DSM 5388 TaxID=1121324 RepID=A0A069RBR8_PEPLI|nr:shikimate dehydrogenase [Peptoclostridium litorale]KDR94491.1 shikimate dehydrogenase AroE [Peptoclostridium litorale DSM 5388]SIO35810.1 shikimate dehydrogenase [Peptoclostridium litorale DSM 5388]
MKNGLYGLLGEKLSHSMSPQIHSIIFEKLQKSGCYHIFEVKKADLKPAVKGLLALGARGVNVTIPYKQNVMESLDYISDEAAAIGAVNTIHFKDGAAMGYNTDYYGFKMMLDKFKVEIKGKSFAVLGSGGAAKSVVKCLEDFGAKRICMVSRNAKMAGAEFTDIEVIDYNELAGAEDMDTAINCTPCGMHPCTEESPLDEKSVQKFSCVVDLIYNPKTTMLMKQARAHGIKAVNGLYMLVGQAVKAQEIWNDVQISDGDVEDIYRRVDSMV